jgi:hypothetical protein
MRYDTTVQRWVWVTMPESWAELRGGRIEEGEAFEWTCHKDSRRGDIALLYRADAAMDLAHVFKIDGLLGERPHPVRRDDVEWWCASATPALGSPGGAEPSRLAGT